MPVQVTRIEFDLLSLFVRNEGKLLTHRTILREVWGPAYQIESHYLHVYISQAAGEDRARPAPSAVPDHRAGRRLPADPPGGRRRAGVTFAARSA